MIPKCFWFLLFVMTLLSGGGRGLWGLIFNKTALGPHIILFICSTFVEAKKQTNMCLDPSVICLRDVLHLGNPNKSQTFVFFLFSFYLALKDGGLSGSMFVCYPAS